MILKRTQYNSRRYSHYARAGIATAGLLLSIGFLSTAGMQAQAQVPDIFPAGRLSPVVGTESGASEVQLAQHLSSVGARYYGAWWCPFCHEQRALFGREAVEDLPYVECDLKGRNSQNQLCQDSDIMGYPTWEINGEMYAGMQELDVLADLSGYTGPRDFSHEVRSRSPSEGRSR